MLPTVRVGVDRKRVAHRTPMATQSPLANTAWPPLKYRLVQIKTARSIVAYSRNNNPPRISDLSTPNVAPGTIDGKHKTPSARGRRN
eukprot:6244538-Lingulodinium_polyedra.AAC.1